MKKLSRSLSIFLVALLVLVSFAGCVGTNQTQTKLPQKGVYPMTITDSLSREVTIQKEPTTIVSVSPSNTETIFALGEGENLIGVTTYCNYPTQAQKIEKMGDYNGPSTEKIIAANPDIVLAENVPEETLKMLEDAGITVFATKYESINDVYNNILVFGRILNRDSEAEKTVANIKDKIATVKEKIKGETSKRVFIDLGGFYSVNDKTFIGEIIKELGCENIAGKNEIQWPALSKEDILSSDPEVYISTYTSIEELKKTDGFENVSAFKNASVYTVTSEQSDIIQRPGPRMGEAFQIYAQLIYPNAFQ